MNVLLFGATGMVGQGVLRECLADPDVRRVVTVGRSPSGQRHDKLRELILPDLADLSSIITELSWFDACVYCLGVSAAGMSEAAYTKLTYDLTLSIASLLAKLNPAMTFLYVSGMGTDSTEVGRVTWARVKGRTENALLRVPFKAAYMFRPGLIIPGRGIVSKTMWYRVLYAVLTPLFPLLNAMAPNYVTTTERLGRAMVKVARQGYAKPILETSDINSV